MARIEKAVRNVSLYLAGLCAVALLGWVFIFTMYIIGRLFGQAWLFVEEYTGYWLVLLFFAPLAYTSITRAHIKTTFVIEHLPEKVRRVLEICTDTIAVAIVCYLLGRSIEWVISGIKLSKHSTTSLYTPLWPVYLIISIGLASFVLALTLELVFNIRRLVAARDGDTGS